MLVIGRTNEAYIPATNTWRPIPGPGAQQRRARVDRPPGPHLIRAGLVTPSQLAGTSASGLP